VNPGDVTAEVEVAIVLERGVILSVPLALFLVSAAVLVSNWIITN
jgi:hypothetical protein